MAGDAWPYRRGLARYGPTCANPACNRTCSAGDARYRDRNARPGEPNVTLSPQSSQGPPSTTATEGERAPNSALASWVMFDWASQPFYTLILTFLFAPYFANHVVANAVTGQSYWGYATAIAGLIIAIASPLLGAVADRHGARKPWIAAFSILLVVAMSCLWIARPNADGGTILFVLFAFIMATIMAEFATVFTNSIMPSLVRTDEIGRLSGIGWAAGYAGGLVSLAVMAGLIVGDSKTGTTLLGLEPLFALDFASHQGDRLVGPFSALWYALFIIPFFLFVPDTQSAPQNIDHTQPGPFAELWDTIRTLPSFHDMLYFLLARMLYTDGLSAIFAFGGIYGASVFGWGPMELGLFGIILTIAGVVGAVVGGWANDSAGSRTVISVSLFILMIAVTGLISVDRSSVFFVIDVVPKADNSGAFSATGEHFFLLFAILVGLVAAPVQSASRVLLARLAPEDKRTQFFGLFAFSGKVTAFLAPLLVAVVTAASGSQRLGMATIFLFLISGFVLLRQVKANA